MYPEEGASGAPPAEYYPETGIKSKLAYHLEGLIPLILILIIAFFLAIKFGIITSSTPVVGIIAEIFEPSEKPMQMLIIGNTSVEVLDVLNANEKLVHYRIKSAESLSRNPIEQLRNYDVVMLDQSEEANKEVSYELGQGIEQYVKTGGKFILIKDSGIRRPGAVDIIGWKNTFRDVVPVECELKGPTDVPSCTQPLVVRGKVMRLDEDHPIMEGIEIAPPEPSLLVSFTVFDINPIGNEVAYIEDPITKKSYPAIVEKRLLIGKSIYFNYNPGKTRGILESTLRYLK